MSRPKIQQAPPPPPPPPSSLVEVDEELKRLGYSEEKGIPERPQDMTSESNPEGAATYSGPSREQQDWDKSFARINELLGYRKKFLTAEDKIRTSAAKGRAATILTSASARAAEAPTASRALLENP